MQISDQKVLEAKISEYNVKVTELWDGLMGLEMQLVDQLEVTVSTEREIFVLWLQTRFN